MKISFIVPIFNNLAETQEMYATLKKSIWPSLNHEIVLADDASTDEVTQWLRSIKTPKTKLIFGKSNLGYASNTNSGVKASTGEILCLLNSDLIFKSGWLEPMLEILLDPTLNAGIVGNVQYKLGTKGIDHAGVTLSPNAQLHHERMVGRDSIKKVFAATGACMLMRRNTFINAGGLDPAYMNGCEDIDLCLKVRKTGKSVYIACKSTIIHHVSLSRGSNSERDILNSKLLFDRWRPDLKRELSKVWRALLNEKHEENYGLLKHLINFELTPELAKTPHAASILIAESMLTREETHWKHTIMQTKF